MDVYVKDPQRRSTVISTITLAIHFLTLKQEYMRMTTDTTTPEDVRLNRSHEY